MRYLALLRGINVGGNNIIPMKDLKHCFGTLGHTNVSTYIQSGNIIFDSTTRSFRKLTSNIESALANRFGYNARAFVIGANDYSKELKIAHLTFGKNADMKHNAMFVIGDLKPQEVLDRVISPVRELEYVSIGSRTIFWSVNRHDINKTAMMTLAKNAVYKELTVRNHNTTFKLLDLLCQG